MRAPWLLVAVCLLAAAPALAASGSPCAAACLQQGKAFEWTKNGKKACRTACKQQNRKCGDLPKADRDDCRVRNTECVVSCATGWPDAAETKDRIACQPVCGSCYRAGTAFCVEVRTDPPDLIADCCGGTGKPDCCPPTNPGGLNQCVDLSSDASNCGECGRECDAAQGQICNAGVCTALPTCPGGCSAGLVCCATDTVGGGRCVSLAQDHDHCGACGMACGATQACQGGSCVQGCVDPVFPVPCPASGPTSPSCCTPEEKCCPGDYGFNSCWSPKRVNDLSGSSISSKDEIQCCRKTGATAQETVTRGCPSDYTCCFSDASFSSCCPPGFTCNASGLCDPP